MQTAGHGMMIASYMGMLPGIVVMIVGIVLALVRWKIHPRASAFAIVGLGIMLLNRLCSTAIYSALPSVLSHSSSFEVSEMSAAMLGLRVLDGLISGAGLALVLAAVFCDRAHKQQPAEQYGQSVAPHV